MPKPPPPRTPSEVADLIKVYDDTPLTTITMDAIIAAETGTPCPDWEWVHPEHDASAYANPARLLARSLKCRCRTIMKYHSSFIYRTWYRVAEYPNVNRSSS
eukprot:TRINITY_DN5512_c0_g1_i1.p1 TRINITY_DN5512_c0_g1~~TRINITY_DN5512_c0_g1_i1.p1  ORF type:complete len:102 (-),score=7.28 TRINITY_DN5512_c0_g1_i1:422-727(-)